MKAMNRHYVYAVNAYDFTYDAICCDYNNAHVWLNELLDELSERFYPVKACILNDKMDVVYKTEVMRKNDVPDAETLPRQVHAVYKTEVKGNNDSEGRSNRTDKT